MQEVILVKAEHIEPGKKKYVAVRDPKLEALLQKGKSPAEVYKFNDGRILTVNPLLGFGLLYQSEEVFLNKVVLE